MQFLTLRNRGRSDLAPVSLLILCVVGCSSASGPPRPKTVKVTGTVTYKGLPVEGATVSFLGNGETRAAVGLTDAKGHFELTTFDAGDGAVPGNHQVTVTKFVAKSTGAAKENMEDASKRSPEAQNEPPQSLIPERYANASTTDITREVKPSGTNDFPIELKD
jgi:hypothetical protein